ncbi:AAA family ATPase [Curtanaerobium respiraculi]|uniref:AAA family ATPase n=1 Tax=Curtanaerobium respiraculi TaxID=2949669 RepID=UPI0024B34F65|nr:AAA family ATPase [Curtanaerobium respiraculi]
MSLASKIPPHRRGSVVEGFEKAVNWLHASEKYDIYITGSNAFLMSSDLATLFTGRTFEIYPFSFSEYREYFGNSSSVDAAFESYTRTGGMSGSHVYKNEGDRYRYVADVFDTLIVRDIRQKHGIRNPEMLNRLADFMMDNISNISSARSIADALKKRWRKGQRQDCRRIHGLPMRSLRVLPRTPLRHPRKEVPDEW